LPSKHEALSSIPKSKTEQIIKTLKIKWQKNEQFAISKDFSPPIHPLIDSFNKHLLRDTRHRWTMRPIEPGQFQLISAVLMINNDW
jgi:hypothetical protein